MVLSKLVFHPTPPTMEIFDHISDFFKNLRERFSNPFFSAFIVAWLFLNWQVPLALLAYDTTMLKSDGYVSYADMIRKTVQGDNAFLYPLLVAILYPLARNLLNAVHGWFKSWGSRLYFWAAGGGKVSVQEYIKMRHNFQERQAVLEKLVANHTNVINQVDAKQNELHRSQEQNRDLIVELQKWKASSNLLEGVWQMTFAEVSMIISITSNQINEVRPGTHHVIALIDAFDYNPSKEQILMVVKLPSHGGSRPFTEPQIHQLSGNATRDEFKGYVNFKHPIHLKRAEVVW